MKVLSTVRNATDRSVPRLQAWLSQFHPTPLTGVFDEATKESVKVAQGRFNLLKDGVVGPRSWAAFLANGFLPEELVVKADYPAKPSYRSLTTAQKIAKFGRPMIEGSEPLLLDKAFADRVEKGIDLADWFPQAKDKGFGSRYIDLHKDVFLQWTKLFDQIVALKLQDRILTCAGSWVVRYVRNTTQKTPSSHSFATAVDFNAPQNWLGAQPAKKGETGSLVEIIELLPTYKMYSGIWFSTLDGMHIESTVTDGELGL
jgi:hypothetical protein